MINQRVQLALEAKVGSGIASANRLTGGSINAAFHLTLRSGVELFLKYGAGESFEQFEAERHGLDDLRPALGQYVPRVIACGDRHAPYLALEYFPPTRPTPELMFECGRLVAKLHQAGNDRFGLAFDNFIGRTPQLNRWNSDWGDFFWECRIMPQLRLGQDCGWVDHVIERMLRQKEGEIRQTIVEHRPTPALCHGDLWSGNIHYSNSGPVLIDPAVYYGDRETDIAMLSLFGGLSSEFLEGYESELPLVDGHLRRRRIYNLYHLMNHANLFGGSYITETLNEIGGI